MSPFAKHPQLLHVLMYKLTSLRSLYGCYSICSFDCSQIVFIIFSFLSFLFIFILNHFYCYSIRVVPFFSPLPSSAWPTPSFHSPFPHCCPCPRVIHRCSCLVTLPSFHDYPPPPPLWSLSACSMFPCLWFYFVH